MSRSQEERLYLDMLRDNITDFPQGAISEPEPDPPDFVVASPRHRVGIEVTRIYQEAATGEVPPRQNEAEQEAVVEQARRIAVDRCLPHLLVSVYFREDA
jgi:hypothetical protein